MSRQKLNKFCGNIRIMKHSEEKGSYRSKNKVHGKCVTQNVKGGVIYIKCQKNGA